MKHLTTEELAIYVEYLKGGPIKKLPQEIIDHIETCDECASEAIEIYEIEKEELIVPSTRSKIIPLYYATAAIAASLLVFLVFQFNLLNTKSTDPQISGNKYFKDTMSIIIDTATEKNNGDDMPEKNNNIIKEINPKKEELLAKAYQPNSDLENLVDRYRGTLRGDDVEVITPIELRLKKGSPVTFKWNSEGENSLTVEVFNNKGEKIEESSTMDTKYKSLAVKSPGIYYWKLFNEDFDLIFCGKVIIK